MKKFAFVLALIIILAIPTTANAATSRALKIMPSLTFSDTTATCGAVVIGDATYEYLVVTVKLWDGYDCLGTWTGSGCGYVSVSGDATVTKGQTYTVTVEVMKNGTSQPSVSTSGTC